MKKIAVYLILGAIGLLILYVGGSWIFQRGIFKPGPSAAARQQPKVERSVTKTGKDQSAAVDKSTEKADKNIQATEERVRVHVVQIRSAERATLPGAPDAADPAWFTGMCQSVIYAGDPVCSSYGSGPKGRDSANLKRTLPWGRPPATAASDEK